MYATCLSSILYPILVNSCQLLSNLFQYWKRLVIFDNFSFEVLYWKQYLKVYKELKTYTPKFTTQMPVRQIPLGGGNRLRTRTLVRNTIESLLECVVSKMSGPPPKTTQDRTQRTHTQSVDKNWISDPAANRIRAAGTLPTTPWRQTVVFINIQSVRDKITNKKL